MDNRQRAHYERIHKNYAAHYYDGPSLDYRRRFLLAPLLAGIDLNGRRGVELACGDGHTSALLMERYPETEIEGMDISPTACEEYRRLVGRPASVCDLLGDAVPEAAFDYAVVMGGLHHMVADFDKAVGNITKMLRPGALLLAVEPSSRFALNRIRDLWYRADHWFDAATERPLLPEEITAAAGGSLRLEDLGYFGGPAYYLVLNSLIMRVPLGVKRAIAAPLMACDAVFDRLPGRVLFPAFRARWRRA